MKTISKQAVRERMVGSILASLRIEQLVPSAVVIDGMKACVAGTNTTEKLLADIVSQHVTLRRN